MRELLARIEQLRQSEVGMQINARIHGFKNFPEEEVFGELCFCLLTANFNAERSIKIQEEIGDGFFKLSRAKLAGKLKSMGHRFPNKRAEFIVEARKHDIGKIRAMFPDGFVLREWLVRNVKGLGWKEASHFLRNVGYLELAIVDFHIIDILADNGLIERPKVLTKQKYLEIEDVLKGMASKLGMSLGELDLYLWYLETGKVLK